MRPETERLLSHWVPY